MKVINHDPAHTPAHGDVIAGMPNAVYHRHPSINNSGLSLMARSPAHYRYGPARQQTRAMVIGNALHSAILEPEIFSRDFVNAGTSDRRASEYKQAVKVIGDADRVLTGPEHDNIAVAVAAVWASASSRRVIETAELREASVFATDPVTGVMVRIRPDLWGDGIMTDVKKTQDARAPAFERAIMNYRYHVQAALYADAWEWATGEKVREFRFLAIEEQPPHAVKIYRIDDTALAEGRRMYREALDLYARCLERDEWPAYDCSEPELIGLPSWLVAQIENDMEVQIDE